MKKILKYSIVSLLALCTLATTGCKQEVLDTDQYAGGVALSAIAPNPVMRGGVLRIIGANLENVSEVRFAGGVSVTDFTVTTPGSHGELRVNIPLEGPEVGTVSIVTKDGKVLTSLAELTFTEPIEVESFSPAEALSGDVITIKGEYLNTVQEVIFGGEAYVTEFVSQSRHELKVVVPSNAVTGFIIVGDVNELVDETTIPNQIYSPTELVIGDPTVNAVSGDTYKSGDVITVTGAHLDMIESLSLNGASDVEFTVAEDGKSLSFTLPASASDGAITLVSYAGKSFSAGEIETVTVSDLGIASLAEDGRYKAGCNVEITGSDLDLVTKLEFANAEASFYLDGGKIYATLPAEAKDGSVTVTLESGKQAYTPEIEVVKPVITGVSATTAVAGKESLTVYGEDLDLVSEAKIGDKAQSFITCDFMYNADGTVTVGVPSAAYTGVITLAAANGYESTTDVIEVSYDEAISISFDAPSFALGKTISLTGANLLQVESVSIKGIKVTQYQVRGDTEMSFTIPDGIGPGVYRLDLVLLDGSEITWPVPFEITAAYTETFIWEGREDLGSWGNQPYLGADGAFVEAGIAVGDIVRLYYTPTADWFQIQIFGGHWEGMTFPELDGGNTVTPENTDPSAGYFAFEVTNDNFGILSTIGGWGGALLTQGENAIITGVSLIKFTAAETVVWEGTSAHTGDYATNLELGGEDDWVNAELWEGAEVRIYFKADDPSDWSMQIFDGHWGGMGYVTPNGVQFNQDNAPEAIEKGYVSFKAEGDAFTALTTHAWWGYALIVQGKNLVVTKLAFI